ncbi:MAG: ribonuclease III [Parvularculaceae bacterium]
MSAADLDALQTRLGWRFRDPELLARALTHASLAASSRIGDLERLEFLGDRVLGLLAAELLWRRFPDMDEGDLAPRLNALVRKETCADAARAIDLGPALRLSAHEADAGGRDKTAILGDACEALLGALYVDGGLEASRRVFNAYWTDNLDRLLARIQDAKTALQEWSQDRGLGVPRYETTATDGPDHAPDFTVAAHVSGLKPATGRGRSKRAAQMAAAEALLEREGVWAPRG